MKRCFFALLMLAGAPIVFAGGLRLGAAVSAEFREQPDFTGITQEFDSGANLMAGLYWELARRKLGFGMSCLLDREKVAAPAPVNSEIWLDWIASADLRYHLLGSDAFLDPFFEVGLGTAGRSNRTDYEAAGAGSNDYTPTNLSLFGQIGGGLAMKLSVFQIGARLDWRIWNSTLPGAEQDPYPLKTFSAVLFGGLAF